MRVRTVIIGTSAIGMMGLWFTWTVWIRPSLVAGRQVRTWADVSAYVQFLEEYRGTYGRFPATLTEAVPERVSNRVFWLAARDSYGHPLHYESDGTQFLVASFGRDGVRDHRERLRQHTSAGIDDSPCYDANVDTVYSSNGVRQLCGK